MRLPSVRSEALQTPSQPQRRFPCRLFLVLLISTPHVARGIVRHTDILVSVTTPEQLLKLTNAEMMMVYRRRPALTTT